MWSSLRHRRIGFSIDQEWQFPRAIEGNTSARSMMRASTVSSGALQNTSSSNRAREAFIKPTTFAARAICFYHHQTRVTHTSPPNKTLEVLFHVTMATLDELHGLTAVPRSLDKLIADQTSGAASTPLSVNEIGIPKSPLAASVRAYAKQNLPAKTFNHSMRVYYYGVDSRPSKGNHTSR